METALEDALDLHRKGHTVRALRELEAQLRLCLEERRPSKESQVVAVAISVLLSNYCQSLFSLRRFQEALESVGKALQLLKGERVFCSQSARCRCLAQLNTLVGIASLKVGASGNALYHLDSAATFEDAVDDPTVYELCPAYQGTQSRSFPRQKAVAMIYANLSATQASLGLYRSAIDSCLLSLGSIQQVLDQTPDPECLALGATISYNLGTHYERESEYSTAYAAYQTSLDLSSRVNTADTGLPDISGIRSRAKGAIASLREYNPEIGAFEALFGPHDNTFLTSTLAGRGGGSSGDGGGSKGVTRGDSGRSAGSDEAVAARDTSRHTTAPRYTIRRSGSSPSRDPPQSGQHRQRDRNGHSTGSPSEQRREPIFLTQGPRRDAGLLDSSQARTASGHPKENIIQPVQEPSTSFRLPPRFAPLRSLAPMIQRAMRERIARVVDLQVTQRASSAAAVALGNAASLAPPGRPGPGVSGVVRVTGMSADLRGAEASATIAGGASRTASAGPVVPAVPAVSTAPAASAVPVATGKQQPRAPAYTLAAKPDLREFLRNTPAMLRLANSRKQACSEAPMPTLPQEAQRRGQQLPVMPSVPEEESNESNGSLSIWDAKDAQDVQEAPLTPGALSDDWGASPGTRFPFPSVSRTPLGLSPARRASPRPQRPRSNLEMGYRRPSSDARPASPRRRASSPLQRSPPRSGRASGQLQALRLSDLQGSPARPPGPRRKSSTGQARRRTRSRSTRSGQAVGGGRAMSPRHKAPDGAQEAERRVGRSARKAELVRAPRPMSAAGYDGVGHTPGRARGSREAGYVRSARRPPTAPVASGRDCNSQLPITRRRGEVSSTPASPRSNGSPHSPGGSGHPGDAKQLRLQRLDTHPVRRGRMPSPHRRPRSLYGAGETREGRARRMAAASEGQWDHAVTAPSGRHGGHSGGLAASSFLHPLDEDYNRLVASIDDCPGF